MSVLTGNHPSDGISPAHHWLWWRRVRRRRASDLRRLLLRGHGVVADEVVDEAGEVDEECARANAGSGSHNLDAPYLARQRCRGKLSATNTYGTGAPFRYGKGAEGAQRADRGKHAGSFTQVRAARMRKTLLLLGCVLSLGARSLKKQLHERENDLGFEPHPPHVVHGPPFIVQGVTNRCQRRRKG